MISAYNRNEPGILFVDTINRLNPVSYCEYISCTNPCGQIGMETNVCNLFYINLVKHFNVQTKEFDMSSFKKAIEVGVRFLDNILDISSVPIDDYIKAIQEKRKIGLGVMGQGSLLYMMKLRFGSPEAIQFIENLFKTKAQVEYLTSAKLGKQKGSFKAFDRQKYFNTH